MTTAKNWKYWLRTLGYPQSERADRRTPSGLAAMHGSVSSPKLSRIKTISATGLYLQTTERWPIDEVVSLTLQKEGPTANSSEFQIDVQARVASYGDDGVGLGFVLPEGLNLGLWAHLINSADAATETEDIQFIFRMVRAILFLYRLCPAKAKEPIYVLIGELDEFRTRSMLEIALTAEKMLTGEADAERMHAHPQVVASVLRDGSWEHDELTQQLWAGLLVSSCSEEGTDESNRELIELLVQLTASQAHILVEACRRAKEQMTLADEIPRSQIIITPEEMIHTTGMYDLYRSATDVAYLHHYGLIENNFDFSTYLPKKSFDITPSRLGMKLFKACRGHVLEGGSTPS